MHEGEGEENDETNSDISDCNDADDLAGELWLFIFRPPTANNQ
jgi:hypothetical protein